MLVMAVIAMLVRASMVAAPALIDITRAVVSRVLDARRIVDSRARIVDRRSLIIRGRDAIVDRRRRVHSRRPFVVSAVVMGRRVRGDAGAGNCTDRAPYDGAIAALNIVADCGADAGAD